MVTMSVQRVSDARGSHIEPALDPEWDNLTKLQWHAAVIAVDTGYEIWVRPGDTSILRDGVWETIADQYNVTIKAGEAWSDCGAGNFGQTWSFLEGVRAGARAAEPHWSIVAN